jgi:hypothetical protein
MDAVNPIPTAFSEDVVGVKDSLNSLLLKYLGGNTIQFRPYLTESGLYTFDFTLRVWSDVNDTVVIDNEVRVVMTVLPVLIYGMARLSFPS